MYYNLLKFIGFVSHENIAELIMIMIIIIYYYWLKFEVQPLMLHKLGIILCMNHCMMGIISYNVIWDYSRKNFTVHVNRRSNSAFYEYSSLLGDFWSRL